MSYPEALLWQRLREAPGAIRSRRQHPIGSDYIADFYCASARLAIEVDGETHGTGIASAYDADRDGYMASRNLGVVRICARDVLCNANAAANAIVLHAARPLHHQPAAGGPPPRAGEEQE